VELVRIGDAHRIAAPARRPTDETIDETISADDDRVGVALDGAWR
jgi:hypothetical protein